MQAAGSTAVPLPEGGIVTTQLIYLYYLKHAFKTCFKDNERERHIQRATLKGSRQADWRLLCSGGVTRLPPGVLTQHGHMYTVVSVQTLTVFSVHALDQHRRTLTSLLPQPPSLFAHLLQVSLTNTLPPPPPPLPPLLVRRETWRTTS